MKKTIFLLLCLVLVLGLCVPGLAFVDHDKVYTAVDAVDNSRLETQGLETLPRMAEDLSFDLHVDIVSSTEDETLEDYAKIFYDQYEYGYGEDHDGALLMILLGDRGDSVDISGYTIYGGGSGLSLLLEGGSDVTRMTETLDSLLTGEALPYEDAGQTIADAIDTFSGCMMSLVTLRGEDHSSAVQEAINQAAGDVLDRSDDSLVLITEENESLADPAYEGRLIRDGAGLLTESQVQTLEELAQSYSSQYGCNIYIHTVDSMGSETNIERYSETYYNDNNLGSGAFRNGITLTLAMDSRDYDLSGYGRNPENIVDYGPGILAFTDYGRGKIVDKILPDLSDGDYYDAFTTYVKSCGEYLEFYAEHGEGIDVGNAPKSKAIPLAITIIVPLIIALIVCLIFRGQMKTAKLATQADDYMPRDGMRLSIQTDRYTHTTQTRRHIERNNSGGSGGGTSVNSGGFSHSSGKF